MARITVEDCLEKVPNRFALVLLAAKRTKQRLSKAAGGQEATSPYTGQNKPVVISLREIADGMVRFMTEDEALQARARKKAEEEARAQERAQALENQANRQNGATTASLDALFASPPAPSDADDDDEE